MTGQIQAFIEQYWVLLALIFAYFQNPALARSILAKIGIGSDPLKKPDALELLNLLNRLNVEHEAEAEDELFELYKKFSAKVKPKK